MLQLRIEKIKKEAPDTATFYLRPADGTQLLYSAGQFITIVFEHHGTEIRRSYSISSSPDEEFLAITVKRVPNGELSRYLVMYAQVGDVWQAIAPTGKFVVDEGRHHYPIFFFAAGSGITPIFSQIKHLLGKKYPGKLVLIYSNRNVASILFKTELDDLQQLHPDALTVIHLLSEQGRRLNNVSVEQLVKQYAINGLDKAAFYLCGPFAFMRMVRFTLIFMGVHPQNIRKENFVLETVPVMLSPVNHAPHVVKIIYKGTEHNIRGRARINPSCRPPCKTRSPCLIAAKPASVQPVPCGVKAEKLMLFITKCSPRPTGPMVGYLPALVMLWMMR